MKLTPKQKDQLFPFSIPLGLIVIVGAIYIDYYYLGTILIGIGLIFLVFVPLLNPFLELTMKIRKSNDSIDDIGIVKKTNENGKSEFRLTFYSDNKELFSRLFYTLEGAEYYYEKFKSEIENRKKINSLTEERIK